MAVLPLLASHNAWANRRIFAAAAAISAPKLADATDGYDSVLGIFRHLVQVEHSFFELAHGRAPGGIRSEDLSALRRECTQLDQAYVDYARQLDSAEAEANQFVVPWFGFKITLAEGIVQPLTHSHKHRSDISMLLPRLGGSGVEMDFIHWLAEERGRDAGDVRA